MHSAGTRTLEFTILSAEDLRIDGRPVKKNAFAVVRTDPSNSGSTRADLDGGSYPLWNEKVVVEMSMPMQKSVTVEVQCRVGSGNRVVGSVAVPVSEFLGGLTPEDYLHFLSYRLRDPRGVRNGIVNFSVRVIGGGGGGGSGGGNCSAAARKKVGVESCGGSSPYSASRGGPSSSSSSSWGVPAVGGSRSNYGDASVVTGVPVWGSSRG
ncbi:unnamed protein product [Linum tenue]|uniref:C2 domain-containing protein n=1 Tax=Linum tenue TaxID=586396 RepID=A0AAV0N3G6_9ROSI|nr:unnamed protein product [Linum tenue]